MNWLPAIFRRDSVPSQQRSYSFSTEVFKSDPGWFQKALDNTNTADVGVNTAVYGCVNILSQEVASLAVHHWKLDDKGSRSLVKNSQATRVLRKPNPYQTRSDFWLYMMRSLLFNGTAFASVTRNGRTEVAEMHPLPPRSCSPMVNPETGDVFYSMGDFGDGLFRPDRVLPASEVFNPRINCNKHPLVGETPIAAVVYAGATGNSIQRSIARFFGNMARPSGVLTTPKPLTKKQIDELRDQWAAVSQGAAMGQTPVLHSDLKWEQITMSATDAEVIASYNLAVSDIAMAYRVPLFMLGDLSKATFRNVETLMRLFYTSSLRFYLEHLENALNQLFQLDGENEYLEFDIESGLLRGDLESRMTALSKGVQGGVITPNEARRREELPPVEGGDEAFLQRQMVPISLITQIIENEAKRLTQQQPAAAPAGEDDGEDDTDEEGEGEEDAQRSYFDYITPKGLQ